MYEISISKNHQKTQQTQEKNNQKPLKSIKINQNQLKSVRIH